MNFNLIENICKKPRADTVVNGERRDASLLILGVRQECLRLSLLLNVTVQVPAKEVRQEKGSKRQTDCKGGRKTV